jgi:hypothetical protein
MTDHMKSCKEVIEAVRQVLKTVTDENVSNEEKLCRLSSVLQCQSAGQNGAGLTGGQQQESLWVDMLTSANVGFSQKSDFAIDDADYYFKDYPISHKTIGWNGNGALALAWSKNPPGGLQRTEFKASMAVALTRKSSGGMWANIPNGYYVVPLDYLQKNIEFSSNNKTDSLIKPDQVITAIRYANSVGLMLPLAYNHEWGKGKHLSYWGAGLQGITNIN